MKLTSGFGRRESQVMLVCYSQQRRLPCYRYGADRYLSIAFRDRTVHVVYYTQIRNYTKLKRREKTDDNECSEEVIQTMALTAVMVIKKQGKVQKV